MKISSLRSSPSPLLALSFAWALSCANVAGEEPDISLADQVAQELTATSDVCLVANEHTTMTLTCPAGQVIQSIGRVSYGTPYGPWCTGKNSTCHSATSSDVLVKACAGQASCSVLADNAAFGDPCPGTAKRLVAQVTCGAPARPPLSGAVSRPASNTGTGFFVSGDKLYDANGFEFRIRGVNHAHWWAGTGEQAIPSIAGAGANTSRAVFGPGGGADTPELRRGIAEQYVKNGVVPMVEYHSGTCGADAAQLKSIVDLWVGPDKAWLKSLERYAILNIANEWGPNSTVWRDAYVTAIARLRAAGVNNAIVIDAGGDCGQNASSIEAWGRDIFNSDPQKNVVFSIHMYGFWHNAGDPAAGSWEDRQPYDMAKEIALLKATGLPIIVGEFSWNGFVDVPYDTRLAVATYEKLGVGWLAWMWNNPTAPIVNIANGDVYASSSDLTPFGRLIVEDPALGWKALARRATVFGPSPL